MLHSHINDAFLSPSAPFLPLSSLYLLKFFFFNSNLFYAFASLYKSCYSFFFILSSNFSKHSFLVNQISALYSFKKKNSEYSFRSSSSSSSFTFLSSSNIHFDKHFAIGFSQNPSYVDSLIDFSKYIDNVDAKILVFLNKNLVKSTILSKFFFI